MKRALLLTMILASQFAMAECDIKSASILTDEHVVGPIHDYKETITEGQCTVQFRVNVNGEWHDVENTQKDRWTKEVALCRYAIKDGKEKLLAGLGGKFQTQAITVCQEGQKRSRKIRIGDTILENEVGRSKVDGYYSYKNMRCRNFTEQYVEDQKLKIYYGVICKTDTVGSDWIVLDKW